MKENSKIKFLKDLRDSNFTPYFSRKDIKKKGKFERLSDEGILAEIISKLINEEGPQFVSELTNAILNEDEDRSRITVNFHSIMRGKNSHYEKLGILSRQFYKALSWLYPNEKITSCRGVHSRSNILFKTEDSLRLFVDENFRFPRQGYPYWQYLPKNT